MQLRSTAALSVVALAASPAHAQPTITEEDARKIGSVVVEELTKEDTVPYKSKLLSGLVGFHGDVAGVGELRLGYGKGKFRRSMKVPTVTLKRLELAVRGAYGRTDSVAGSLLVGYSKVSYLGFQIGAGLNTHFAPGDLALGPIGTIALRVGPFGLHTSVWTHLTGDESDVGFTIGLGFTQGDFKTPADVAKERAKERVKLELENRGIPVP